MEGGRQRESVRGVAQVHFVFVRQKVVREQNDDVLGMHGKLERG